MLWAVKIFLLAGALLVLQSAWAFVDGFRFLRFSPEETKQPAGKLYAIRRRGDSLQGGGCGI